jgi:hypothetical protein
MLSTIVEDAQIKNRQTVGYIIIRTDRETNQHTRIDDTLIIHLTLRSK